MTHNAIANAIAHLKALVAFDTRNPPRDIGTDGIFAYCSRTPSQDFKIETIDLGEGCVYLHAVRGNLMLLINVHLDTVPAAEGWLYGSTYTYHQR